MFTKEYLNTTVNRGIKKLQEEGFPPEAIEKMLAAAEPMGDFCFIYRDNPMDYAKEQEIFSYSREHGLDGSVETSYGGSSVGTIRGVNPYETPIDFWMDKLNIPRIKDEERTEEIFFAGHVMEPVYREYFKFLYGDRYEVYECDIQFKSKLYPHFILNIDGLVVDKVTKKWGVLEIKHTNSAIINNKTVAMFEEGDLPEMYYNQGTAYTEGLDADFCIYFLGYGNRPSSTKMLRVDRDPLLGKKILMECEEFMTKYVDRNVQPPYTSIKDPEQAKEKMKEEFGPIDPDKETVNFDDALKDDFKALLEAQKAYKAASDAKAKAEEEMKKCQLPFIAALNTATEGTIAIDDTSYVVTYKSDKKVDMEKLEKEYKDIYDKLLKKTISATELKREDKDVYEACLDDNLSGTRKFSFKEVKTKKEKAS